MRNIAYAILFSWANLIFRISGNSANRIRWSLAPRRYVTLYCMTLVSVGKNVAGQDLYAEINGIRVFHTGIDKSFDRMVKKAQKGGYQRIVKRTDQFIMKAGPETVDQLRRLGITVKFTKTNLNLFDSSGARILSSATDEEVILFLATRAYSPAKLRATFQKTLGAMRKLTDENLTVDIGNDVLVRLGRSANGLAPDFRRTPQFLYLKQRRYGRIRIKMTGSRSADFRAAYKAAGLSRREVRKKGKFTWHHLDDLDPVTGECTMQLVETTMHNAVNHTGASKLWKELFAILYK